MARLRHGALRMRNGIRANKRHFATAADLLGSVGGFVKKKGDQLGGKAGRVVSTIGDVTLGASGVAGELGGVSGALREVGDIIGGKAGRVVSTAGDVASFGNFVADVRADNGRNVSSHLGTLSDSLGTGTSVGRGVNNLNDEITTLRDRNPLGAVQDFAQNTGLCNTSLGSVLCTDFSGMNMNEMTSEPNRHSVIEPRLGNLLRMR